MLGKAKTTKLVVLFCFTSVTILYGWVKKLTDHSQISYKNDVENEKMYIRKGKVVILLSNQRSGSSFVGEFFARFNRGFYLYEPLLPYGTDCDQLNSERLEYLQKISQCDFSTLKSSYRYAYATNHIQSHHECLSAQVCSPPRHKTILQRYSKLCQNFSNHSISQAKPPIVETIKRGPCGLPLNLTIWSSLCHSADIVALKVLRICTVPSLEGIVETLTNYGNEVYVIELVRDPRGIINSALNLELRKPGVDKRLNRICGRFRNNFEFVERERGDKFSTSLISEGRYLRIRYEDIATDPVKGAEKMYKFLNMDLPSEVREWIQMSTASPSEKIEELQAELDNKELTLEELMNSKKKLSQMKKEQRNPYGTVRDSSHVVVKWRKMLNMDIIAQIQKKCGSIMTKLGYKLINSIEERNDLSNQLY
ncbi:carbohydrate sulfotransferase 1-like [Styela clava]